MEQITTLTNTDFNLEESIMKKIRRSSKVSSNIDPDVARVSLEFENIEYYHSVQFIAEDDNCEVRYNIYDKKSLAFSQDGQNEKLTDKYYSKLNTVIKNENIEKLYLSSLNDKFDFSKLDLSNIKCLSFYNCTQKFSAKQLAENLHNSIYLTDIHVDMESIETVLDLLKDCNMNLIDINVDARTRSNDPKTLTKYLNIPINSLSIAITDQNLEETLSILEQINAKTIVIDVTLVKNIFDLNLNLNPNTTNIRIKKPAVPGMEPLELGNIVIQSNQPNFDLDLYNIQLTENTHFSVPDGAFISLDLVPEINLAAINDLKNGEYIFLNEDPGVGPEANLENAMIYCSNQNIFKESNAVIRNFDEFLEKIESTYNNKKQKVKK